jgi:L-alanine-DL-glutamate epimerase-like enolase superfamily enzyme
MIVTEIEVHEVECMHHEWIRDTLDHYFEESKRFIFIAHTDTGLTGLGEASSDQSEVIDQYIGTNPFQWIGDSTSLGLGTAMYDLMGKAVGVPVWQLVGPQQRGYVPVGSWTVSAEPAHMAEAVQRYAARGYTWMKYHLSPFQNVIDQVEAIAAVAPPGFKLHLDFTMEPLEGHTYLCERLAQYDCVGVFEDSFAPEDIMAYKELKARAGRPVVLHHAPMGFTTEVIMDMCVSPSLYTPQREELSHFELLKLPFAKTSSSHFIGE